MSVDHPPGDDARPELTRRDAAILAPRLAALRPALEAMATGSAALSGAGRDALAALRSGDAGAIPAALDAGEAVLVRLTTAAAMVRDARPGLLVDLDDGLWLPSADRERVAAVGEALDGVEAMATAWRDASAAMLLPIALVEAVAGHTAAVQGATAAGRNGAYADASTWLADAAAGLERVRRVRDRIAVAGLETATLDGLMVRLADRDAALGALYAALVASDGVRTPAVEAALARVDATSAKLEAVSTDLAESVREAGASRVVEALLVIDDGRGAIEAALGAR